MAASVAAAGYWKPILETIAANAGDCSAHDMAPGLREEFPRQGSRPAERLSDRSDSIRNSDNEHGRRRSAYGLMRGNGNE